MRRMKLIRLKVLFLEFAARVGSILVWIGMWNIIVLMIGDISYYNNITCVCFGFLLWAITEDLNVDNRDRSKMSYHNLS